MIKFTDVGKTYVSKSKSKVEALKGVSFELGANGMTFILGKSGSGKSTLLNLLGGLDKPTVGSIHIDGVDMKSFAQADYESYRNAYVGFVFQEFNLLDDFNVKDNVALALQLSKDDNVEEKVVAALKQVELDEEYLTRRVGELSGGEKQRVAIARAIVKDSKMILADEPTGNLDRETGESIWNILKNLSQSRPVIIVSHDRESAEKYADRIIEISDGKIVADNGAKQAIRQSEQQSFVATKKRLSFVALLKMGFNNLFTRKIKTISIILVSVLALCALLAAQIMAVFLPERSVAKHIRLHDSTYFSVGQGHEGQFGIANSMNADIMRLPTKQYIKQNAQTFEWSYAENKQQLLDFGLEFVGEALELDEHSYYIREDVLNELYNKEAAWNNNDAVIVDGEEVLLIESDLSPQELVGRQVRFNLDSLFQQEINSDEFYTLAGIVKCINVDLPCFIALDEFEGRITSPVHLNELPNEGIIEIGNKKWDKEFSIASEDSLYFDLVLTENGVTEVARWNYEEGKKEVFFNLEDNEIAITFTTLELLFGGKSQSDYLKNGTHINEFTVLAIPEIIGQSMPIKLYDPETGEVLVDYGECVIKGILVYQNNAKGLNPRFYVNNNNLRLAQRKFNKNSMLVRTDSVKNVQSFLVKLRTQYGGYVTDVGTMLDKENSVLHVSWELYGIEQFKEYNIVMLCICAALAAVIVLLVINLITFSINNRKREIGILSALGASAWDITKIFLLETLILSCVILLLSLAGIFSLIAIFNAFFSNIYGLEYVLMYFVVDPYAILTLFGVCFVLLPLFALLPTIRIAKLKPIDAIRVL